MKFGIVLYSVDPEIIWNAFRLAVFAQKQGDSVKIFLLAQGVEAPNLHSEKFDIATLIEQFVEGGGEIMSCTTCLKLRNIEASALCPLATLEDLYSMIKVSDKIITF